MVQTVPFGANCRSYPMRSFFQRSQPKPPLHISLLAGLGGALAIALVSGLSLYGGTPLIMAPFGASCVLLFSVPASPLSQPANVIGGHLLATVPKGLPSRL
jgi:CBS-domain-containing membrane protein